MKLFSLLLIAPFALADDDGESVWNPAVSPTGDVSQPVAYVGAGTETCWATKGEPIDQIKQSTGQVPQYCTFSSEDNSNKRCCTTSHDVYIKQHTKDLWPAECSADEFLGLKELMCFACHPDQPKYTDEDKKIIRVCDTLLKQFYGNDSPENVNLNEPTDAFSKCGGWSDPDTILTPVDDTDPTKGFVVSSDDERLIFPNSEFANAEEFYNNWNQASIPFMDGYRI